MPKSTISVDNHEVQLQIAQDTLKQYHEFILKNQLFNAKEDEVKPKFISFETYLADVLEKQLEDILQQYENMVNAPYVHALEELNTSINAWSRNLFSCDFEASFFQPIDIDKTIQLFFDQSQEKKQCANQEDNTQPSSCLSWSEKQEELYNNLEAYITLYKETLSRLRKAINEKDQNEYLTKENEKELRNLALWQQKNIKRIASQVKFKDGMFLAEELKEQEQCLAKLKTLVSEDEQTAYIQGAERIKLLFLCDRYHETQYAKSYTHDLRLGTGIGTLNVFFRTLDWSSPKSAVNSHNSPH